MRKQVIGVVLLMMGAVFACSRPGSENVIQVTATPMMLFSTDTPTQPTPTPIQPTPNPARFPMEINNGVYTVQAGDTLAMIAARFGVSLEQIIQANGIADANQLEVGQLLQIPSVSAVNTGTSFKIIPDSELVYGPTTVGFDIFTYIKLKPGFLRVYSEQLGEELWSGVQIIDQVAMDYSVNPRLLLALLEYKGGWLSQPSLEAQVTIYPMNYVDPARQGMLRQVLFAANILNEGYYGWRYRGLEATTYIDGSPLVFAPDLNAGTVAVQYFFAKTSTAAQWAIDVSEQGFFQTYLSLFGDPFRAAKEPLTPPDLQQPTLTFPFAAGETWYFTGGPHGGYNTGSAWAAIDFAPPAPTDELLATEGYCYVSDYWATAAAPGVIARSGYGYVVLDLDYDSNEHTGWTIVYLHMATRDIIKAGTRVNTGDNLGHPSCEGGFSTATHLHFARRYNGEWIPVDCQFCAAGLSAPRMLLSGWEVFLSDGAEYQGYMVQQGTQDLRRAEQGREDPINHVSH
ncbi:MAG: LysM peptidoglycan-binding domain-containing protein [Anaerolineales bacterium]|nr:LysM peptidoglycan-binding domain-containing protein [Anaerolineales bacterium]